MKLPALLSRFVSTNKVRKGHSAWRRARPLRLEVLEARETPDATPFPVTFQTPGLLANKGVHALVFGKLTNAYTPSFGPSAGTPLTSGTWVYLAQASSGGQTHYDYAASPSGQPLTLLNLYPNPGTYPNTAGKVAANISVPSHELARVESGQIVFNVGAAAMTITTNPGGSMPSPTPKTNPNDKFVLFEWALSATDLDFDVSEVDQDGFPYSVTSVGAPPPPPADPALGVGMIPDRDTLFLGYNTYLRGLDPKSNALAFLAGAADNPAAPFPVGTRITAPQDIIDVLQADPPVMVSAVPTGKAGDTPVNYYYAVTATSAAGGEGGGVGESMVSNIVLGVSRNQPLALTWRQYPYATGYNVYWSTSPTLSNSRLIQSISGGGTVTWTDASPGSHGAPTSKDPLRTPPANSFLFDPLNRYFAGAIADFFDYYRATGSFVLDDQATMTKWVGQTVDVATTSGGPRYTMLQLTGQAGQWGNQFVGKTLNVYSPVFSTNTDHDPDNNGGVTNFPPAPSWLTNPKESPSSMVFGADGVFGQTDGGTWSGASTLPVGNAKDVYNNIVSALNRGITPRRTGGAWGKVLPPTYWASSPLLRTATGADKGGSLAAGRYRYAITAVDVNRQGPGGTETTPSTILEATVRPDQNAVELQWNQINPPSVPGTGFMTVGSYNIYRSQYDPATGIWGGLQLLVNVVNGDAPPASSFLDDGSHTPGRVPSFVYFANGSSANFYAGYFGLSDVSINGLAYGFPYADKNGQSTNVQMPIPGGLEIRLNPWTATSKLELSPPTPASPVAGTPVTISLTAKKDSGAVDPNYLGSVSFTSTDPKAKVGGVPLSQFRYQFTAADKGVKTFQVTLSTAGVQQVTVRDGANDFQASVSVSVKPGAPVQMAFAAAPQSTFVGQPVPVTLRALDSSGNLATQANGPVRLAGAGLPANTVVRFVNGVARYLLNPKAAGRFALRATTAFANIVSAAFGVATAASFRVYGPRQVTFGREFDLTVAALTAQGTRDKFYAGKANVFLGNERLATAVTWTDGAARVTVAVRKLGPVTLVVRDSVKPNVVLGTIRLFVLPAP